MPNYLFGLISGFFAAYLAWLVYLGIDAVVNQRRYDRLFDDAIRDENMRRMRRDFVERN